jgi:hypothetical protein
MPHEIIGEVGTSGANGKWIAAQATLAIRQIVSGGDLHGWNNFIVSLRLQNRVCTRKLNV